MKTRTYEIEGVAPIVMHNEQLADPINKWSRALKEISKKVKKTDDDLLEMSRREWMGGLYWSEELGVHVPERCIERMLRNAAARSKRGKDVVSGMMVVDPATLKYPGPTDPEKLWQAGKNLLRATVGVNKSRVVRSRPIFPVWSLSFSCEFDENILDARDIDGFVEISGRLEGLCDWRPKHGRFRVLAINGERLT